MLNNWPAGHTINWFAKAQKLGITGPNRGQVLKETAAIGMESTLWPWMDIPGVSRPGNVGYQLVTSVLVVSLPSKHCIVHGQK